MGSSFVITTLKRPNEVRRCVNSILGQGLLPEEITIVDGGEDGIEGALRELIEPTGVRLTYLRSAPGRTHQLNEGVRASCGDPIFFVDDDAELDPDFHEALLRVFGDTPDIGGAQGCMDNNQCRTWPLRVFKAVFLMSRRTKDAPGRILTSGAYTIPVRPTAPRKSEALWLGATAFRRGVFDEHSFDESLTGPCAEEDIDFSYRVGRSHGLVVVPDARFTHVPAAAGRAPLRDRSRIYVSNSYRFWHRYIGGRGRHEMAFLWSMTGRLGSELLKSTLTGRSGYLLGTIDGLREIRGLRRVSIPGAPPEGSDPRPGTDESLEVRTP